MAGTLFEEKTRSAPMPVEFFRQRDFPFGVVKPDANGSLLNRWAADNAANGTTLGVVRKEDIGDGPKPLMRGGYAGQESLLLIVETDQGISSQVYNHEVKHANFDGQIRRGEVTAFGGLGLQTFEELYNYPFDIKNLEGQERIRLIEYNLEHVLISRKQGARVEREDDPAKTLGEMREWLSQIKSGATKMHPIFGGTRGIETAYQSHMIKNEGFSFDSGERPRAKFRLTLHRITIHGGEFIGLTLQPEDTIPVSLLFANPEGGTQFGELLMELGGYQWKNELAQKLLGLAIDRLDGLEKITAKSVSTYKFILSEMKAGRTGDDAAKALAQFVDGYRRQPAPSF